MIFSTVELIFLQSNLIVENLFIPILKLYNYSEENEELYTFYTAGAPLYHFYPHK